MDMLSKLLGVALGVIAVGVAAHFIFDPFYEDAVNTGRMWNVVNWFMAFGVVVALIVNYLRKRALGGSEPDGPTTREYMEVNLVFWAAIMLALWFFWNWFDDLTTGEGPQGDGRLLIWSLINPLFVVVAGITSLHLWRGGSRQ
jgi:hypothetical protein